MATTTEFNQYVERDALSLVLHNVGVVCDVENIDDITASLNGDLFERLWSGDAEPDPVTHARTCTLTAGMLAQMASAEAREYFLKESNRLAKLAAASLEDAAPE